MRKGNLDHMVIWMQQIVRLNMAKYFLHLLAKGTANYRRGVSDLERVNKELGIKMDNN